MKTTLLLLLLLCVLQTSAHSHASMIVSPDTSQHFEYKTVTLSCANFGSGWTVWRYTTDNFVLSQCGSGWGSQTSSTCEITAVKKTDTGVYWCESKHGDSSRTVNITVTGGSVVLQSPVLPVMEGHDVILSCETKTPPSSFSTTFYKNNSAIRTEPTDRMTILNVSKSDEGLYKCHSSRDGESPPSWISVTDDSEPTSLTVSPDSSQLFEYANLTLNCGDDSSSQGWKVIRATTSTDRMSMQTCGDKWGTTTKSGCSIHTTKKPDSAIYWCESPARQRSNSVNITVFGSSTLVILRSPVLPVMSGDNVTLTCDKKSTPSSVPTDFYKDGVLIRTEPTVKTILYRVSKADEGIYWCNISGETSPSSWLFVRDLEGEASFITGETLSKFRPLLHLVVVCLYCISTVLMVSSYRQRSTGRKPPEYDVDQPYDDVIADVTTEHHF